mgnify:CR=1 FL=1
MKYTKSQLSIMKEAWEALQNDLKCFMVLVKCNEEWMQEKTGIKDLKFLRHPKHGQFTGIGIQKLRVK